MTPNFAEQNDCFCLSSLQIGTLSSFQQKGPYSLNCGCIKVLMNSSPLLYSDSWHLRTVSCYTTQVTKHCSYIMTCSLQNVQKRVINKCQVKFHYSNLNITHKQYTGKFTSSWGRKTASSCSRAAWEGGTDKERPGAGGRTARAWSWGESDGENGLFPVGNVRRLAVFTYQKHTMTHSQCL